MTYLFHNGKFIKGKVINNIPEEAYMKYKPIEYYSKFVADNGTTIITTSNAVFPYPTGSTKNSCWHNTVKYFNDKIDSKTEKLQEFIAYANDIKYQITEAYIKEKKQ